MPTINITLQEFRGFMFNTLSYYWDEIQVGGEYGFKTDIGSGYELRVLTSISVESEDEVVRDTGEDAIRVHVVDDSGDIVRSASHTKRLPNYRDRIEEKIEELVMCPECGSDLRVSDSGPYGDYFFCVDGDCGYTESVE